MRTALIAAAGAFAYYAYRSSRKKSTSSSSVALQALTGPMPDECFNDEAGYTFQAQPIIDEIRENVRPEADALYGDRPAVFLTGDAQGLAFSRLAYYRANEPDVDSVTLTAAELAPGCDWSLPGREWSPAMVALHQSIDRIGQVLDRDIGKFDFGTRAWDTKVPTPILRSGQTLNLAQQSSVAFELPSSYQIGAGTIDLTVTVSPASGARVNQLGMRMQTLNQVGSYVDVPVIQLAISGNGKPSRLTLRAKSGKSVTTGYINVKAPK